MTTLQRKYTLSKLRRRSSTKLLLLAKSLVKTRTLENLITIDTILDILHKRFVWSDFEINKVCEILEKNPVNSRNKC